MKIKICGLTREQDIEAVNKIRPDYIGFVFAKSPRQIDVETAKILKDKLDNRIKAVGVFVNEDLDLISDLCNDQIIDVVQLHGDETNDDILRLKEKVSQPIIKAVRIKYVDDILKIDHLNSDYILLDTYQTETHGGSGKRFDWAILNELPIHENYFVAGGIDLKNIRELSRFAPFCVDVSSGVEVNGFKDAQKMREIVKFVRSCRA